MDDEYCAPLKVPFFKSYFEAIRPLPDESRLQLYDAIVDYCFTGQKGELAAVETSLFTLLKPNLDASLRRGKASRDNGQNGGRPKTYEKPTRNLTETYEEPNTDFSPELRNMDIGIGTGNMEMERDSFMSPQAATKQKNVIPPSIDEIRAYINEHGYSVSPEQFHDFYTARGWCVGKTKMRDWRAALRGWQRREPPSISGDSDYYKDTEGSL